MSDFVDLSNPTGNCATDTINSKEYQRIKLTLGDDGINGGDVSSGNPMPVSGAITVSKSGVGPSITYYDVTTLSTEALAANVNRKGGFIQNVSDTIIWVNFGATPVPNQCARLLPTQELLLSLNGYPITSQIKVIHEGSGNKRIIIIEA